MKRKQLEILLSSLRTNPNPQLKFEEYDLDPTSASTIVHLAASYGDVQGKRIVDLGCGTGVLAIAAALMEAKQVVAVDIDMNSVRIAFENMKALGVRVEYVSGAIDCVRGPFDTTIMNPPFGSRRRGLDVNFIRKAIAISKVVYSLHKASEKSDVFLQRKMKAVGKEMKRLGLVQVTLPRTYSFHRKERYRVRANLYRTANQNG